MIASFEVSGRNGGYISWVYHALLIDLYSRRVVGSAMAEHMRTELPLEALTAALASRGPLRDLVHHTDRGSQHASEDYQKALTKAGGTL